MNALRLLTSSAVFLIAACGGSSKGKIEVTGTRADQPIEGLGYVELAGYGPWLGLMS